MASEILPLPSKYKEALEKLGDREPTTSLEAEAVLENIRVGKGYLDEQTQRDLETLPRHSRQTILRVVEKSKETEAAYTKSISEQLYSSRYRFIYELIQNADDSNYSRARSSGKTPYLRFEVTETTLIAETNEDGFTRANVEAICATGKSSKKTTALDNHIGEKGFGFKSVFTVADEVKVQSGLWVFKFQHKQGDDGLGMVTPLKASSEELPSDVVTRIKLRLSVGAGDHKRLLSEIRSIPDTTILNLHNLCKISMREVDEFKTHPTTSLYKEAPSYHGSIKSVVVSKISTNGNGSDPRKLDENKFFLFKRTVAMPKDDRRRDRSSAQVKLAFPIDAKTGKPNLSRSGHYVFAYLPLHQLPVQFIIQSDFITSASRESVIDCSWNYTLREGVTSTFCDAVKAFTDGQDSLRYSCLDYVPKETMRNNFWEPLGALIKAKLQHMPVFQTWQGKLLKLPTQVRLLPRDHRHEGEPIFDDLRNPNEIYVAPEYDDHWVLLKQLGTQSISWDDVLSRVKADLVKSNSKVKTHEPDDPWHEACAQLISKGYKISRSTESFRQGIQRLSLIPINDGKSWTGAPGVNFGGVKTIFFPRTEDVKIPGNIGLNLVEDTAASMSQRRELFRLMGVKECSPTEVLSKIKKAHLISTVERPKKLLVADILDEFRYLFRFYSEPKVLRCWIKVLVQQKTVIPAQIPLYLPSNNEYDTYNLLPANIKDDNSANNVAYFIHQDLIEANSPHTSSPRQDMLWKDWLQIVTGARFYPPLLDPSKLFFPRISETMLAVLKHNPRRFVGMLKAHWDDYQPDVHRVAMELRFLKVPCVSGQLKPFCQCYLPTTEVESKLGSLRAENCVPVLQLPSAWDESTRLQWEFLTGLGVRSRIDLDFYLTIHEQLECRSSTNDFSVRKVFFTELYSGMAGLATASDSEYLRRKLVNIGYFLDMSGEQFAKPHNCVWEGPKFFQSKVVLKRYYGHVPMLVNFFKISLDIADYTLDDVIEELCSRSGETHSEAVWKEIYHFLNDSVYVDLDWDRIRGIFTDHELVRGPDGKMHGLKTCLWTSPFELANHVQLSRTYPDLENFFVERLLVEKANPSLLINEIKNMAKGDSPEIESIQQRIVDIGKLVMKSRVDATLPKALSDLGKLSFLPKTVEGGKKILVGKDDYFAINDHERFGRAFQDHYVLLDFSPEEVHIISTIFSHMDLSSRYLSQTVKEESSVGDDAVESQSLTAAFTSKAYAMYCCAAHYKSSKATRNDNALFNHLSKAKVYTTESITTDLVLTIKDERIRVHSDRMVVHSELVNGQLRFYVPKDERQQKSCYRSQLPSLLANFMGIGPFANQAIWLILSHDIEHLDDILLEQDISDVEWIEKPTYRFSRNPYEKRDNAQITPITPIRQASETQRRETPARSSPSATTFTPASTVDMDDIQRPVLPKSSESSWQPVLYDRFVEEVAQSAYRTSNRQQNRTATLEQLNNLNPLEASPPFEYNHEKTFGNRNADAMAHDRRIGAVGEAYVFEMLSSLELPNFGLDNWRSNMRRELHGTTRYATLGDWQERETADLVYTDRNGSFTQYLRDNCFGSMPDGITEGHDFTRLPIEYFLEVKSTTSKCDTRFFMSASQYERMNAYAVPIFGDFSKVYVLFRVFNLVSNTGLRIYVDPFRFRGQHIDFEIGTWFCKTKEAV